MGNELSTFCCSARKNEEDGDAPWDTDLSLLRFDVPSFARENPLRFQLRALGEGLPHECSQITEVNLDCLAGFSARARRNAKKFTTRSPTGVSQRLSSVQNAMAHEQRSPLLEGSRQGASRETQNPRQIMSPPNTSSLPYRLGQEDNYLGSPCTRVVTIHELESGKSALSVWSMQPFKILKTGQVCVDSPRHGYLSLEACTVSPCGMRFHACHIFEFRTVPMIAVAVSGIVGYRAPALQKKKSSKQSEKPPRQASSVAEGVLLFSLQASPDEDHGLLCSMRPLGGLKCPGLRCDQITNVSAYQDVIVAADAEGAVLLWRLESPYQAVTDEESESPELVAVGTGCPLVSLEVRESPPIVPLSPHMLDYEDSHLFHIDASSRSLPAACDIIIVRADGEVTIVHSEPSSRPHDIDRQSQRRAKRKAHVVLQRKFEVAQQSIHQLALAPSLHGSPVKPRALQQNGQEKEEEEATNSRGHSFSLLFAATNSSVGPAPCIQVWDLRQEMEHALLGSYDLSGVEEAKHRAIVEVKYGPFPNGPLILHLDDGSIIKMDLGGRVLDVLHKPTTSSKYRVIIQPDLGVYCVTPHGNCFKLV
mmetsp:Transcript_21049/g.41291  ORF Transcript_21049/g.41291 Transcript_21049/m.41291 type:complete len:591 (-) Transcript_21049:134-1906(-)